jgi:hypothetical protein
VTPRHLHRAPADSGECNAVTKTIVRRPRAAILQARRSASRQDWPRLFTE